VTLYWRGKTRDELWAQLLETGKREPGWDTLIVGGGITGAGLLSEATALGLESALVEQRDFAWGTSSRSSKMIHGGLRYLASGDFRLSRDSVKERNRLLEELPGLVDPLGFLFSHYHHKYPGPVSLNMLLSIYDLFAGQWNHHYFRRSQYLMMAPGIQEKGLRGGTRFVDAVTDDARLVLRLIQEATLKGALAMNYVQARGLLLYKGKTCGLVVRDTITGAEAEVFAKGVINAAGVWVDRLRKEASGRSHIRPLRGSHLVFPFWQLPVAQSITLMHPWDRRPVFIFPWEGATVVGTTDLDHQQDLDADPHITQEELAYLLAIVNHQFPSLAIKKEDILSTYSGVRPVVHLRKRRKIDPSKEKRDHTIWVEKGLISIGGGKLTTFRIIAHDALKELVPDRLEAKYSQKKKTTTRTPSGQAPFPKTLGPLLRRRLSGRYGSLCPELLASTSADELERIPGTDTLWAELRWAARSEGVVHLEDLLLRRTRVGILLKDGGLHQLDRIKSVCQQELGWDENQWEKEWVAYRDLWRQCYSVPNPVLKSKLD